MLFLFQIYTAKRTARGYEKIAIFRPISRFISEMLQVRAIVTMEGEYENVPKVGCVAQW